MQRAEKILRRRKGEGGVLLGLCAGIGEHVGLDPVLIRLAWVLLALVPASGLAVIVVYFLFALFVPYAPKSGG